MKNIAIVDAHHHLWDLNNEHTKYSWLMVTEGEAFFGDYAAIRKSYLLEDYIKDDKIKNVANTFLYVSAVVIPLITIILITSL